MIESSSIQPLISGVLSTTSTPAKALDRAINHAQLLASKATLRELIEKFLSPKFDRYVSRERRDSLLTRLMPLLEVVEIAQAVRASRDPTDDKFLELAVNGRADVIVTGDSDLLALNPFNGIAILTDGLPRARPNSLLKSESAGYRHILGAHAGQEIPACRFGGAIAAQPCALAPGTQAVLRDLAERVTA